MKIISVVGVRKSGKTTTIEILIRELKRLGFKVGTVKTINCPKFEMESKESSNTYRHKKAGADVVCASGKGETAFIYGESKDNNFIFEHMDVDYLILEGDYESDVPRIVCAHNAKEVDERKNEYTFLVSGRVAASEEKVAGIKAISAVADPENFVKEVLDSAYEVKLPVSKSSIPEVAKFFCQHACKKNCSSVDVAAVEKVKEPKAEAITKRKHVFLTGVKRIGKSTIVNKFLDEIGQNDNVKIGGFKTLKYMVNDELRGFYIHALGEIPAGYKNDVPISVKIAEGRQIAVTETFDEFGTGILKASQTGETDVIVMDELGKLENKSEKFKAEVIKTLNGEVPVIGVLQAQDIPFIEDIKNREDVVVYTITESNRDNIEEIFADMKRSLSNEIN